MSRQTAYNGAVTRSRRIWAVGVLACFLIAGFSALMHAHEGEHHADHEQECSICVVAEQSADLQGVGSPQSGLMALDSTAATTRSCELRLLDSPRNPRGPPC